jgi:hypothetical protein
MDGFVCLATIADAAGLAGCKRWPTRDCASVLLHSDSVFTGSWISSSESGDSMKNFGSGSVERVSATEGSKLLTMLPRALRFLLLFCAFAPRRERRRKSLRKTVADQQEPLSVTKAGPSIEKVDDQPQRLPSIMGQVADPPQAVFKISRTRPRLGL